MGHRKDNKVRAIKDVAEAQADMFGKTSSNLAKIKLAELKKREKKMKDLAVVHVTPNGIVTIYGNGLNPSLLEAENEIAKLRREIVALAERTDKSNTDE